LRIDVLPTIEAVDPVEWDGIVGEDGVIRSHAFLRAVERSSLNDCRFWYLLARDAEGRLLGHCSVFRISLFLDLFATGPMARLTSAIRRVMPGFMRLQMLECGTPVALGHLFSFAPGADRPSLTAAFAERIDRLARDERLHRRVIRDFTPTEMPAFDAFAKRGYKTVPNLPDCVLDNRWPSFDDYLKSMRSEYRYKVRRRMQSAARAGIRCEVRTSFADLAPRLEALWTATYQRSREYQREILTARWFEEMDALGDRSRVVLLLKGDLVVAFAFVLVDDRTLRFLYTGLDYEHNREDSLFFNLLYHVVRTGIELRRPHIELGITTYPPKMDVGGRRSTLLMYMKHSRVPIVTTLFRLMTPAHPEGGRHVFREDPDASAPEGKQQRAGG